MLELIKELMEREWEFETVYNEEAGVYALTYILGNERRMAVSDKDAHELLNEIRTYW